MSLRLLESWYPTWSVTWVECVAQFDRARKGFVFVFVCKDWASDAFARPTVKLNLHHRGIIYADKLAPTFRYGRQNFLDCVLELGVVPELTAAPVPDEYELRSVEFFETRQEPRVGIA